MNKDYIRLYQLWQSGKLQKSEFKYLVRQLPTVTTWLDIIIMWIFNPYGKFNAKQAFCVGIAIQIIAIYIATLNGFHFPSVPAPHELFSAYIKLHPITPFAEQMLQWCVLSLVFYLLSRIAGAKNLRILDFFAFFAMSYLARLIITLYLAILKLISPPFFANTLDIGKLLMLYPHYYVGIWYGITIAIHVWFIRLYFLSLKLASGLSGFKIWVVFVVGIILSSTIYLYCFGVNVFMVH
jgi:hypothetical protein